MDRIRIIKSDKSPFQHNVCWFLGVENIPYLRRFNKQSIRTILNHINKVVKTPLYYPSNFVKIVCNLDINDMPYINPIAFSLTEFLSGSMPKEVFFDLPAVVLFDASRKKYLVVRMLEYESGMYDVVEAMKCVMDYVENDGIVLDGNRENADEATVNTFNQIAAKYNWRPWKTFYMDMSALPRILTCCSEEINFGRAIPDPIIDAYGEIELKQRKSAKAIEEMIDLFGKDNFNILVQHVINSKESPYSDYKLDTNDRTLYFSSLKDESKDKSEDESEDKSMDKQVVLSKTEMLIFYLFLNNEDGIKISEIAEHEEIKEQVDQLHIKIFGGKGDFFEKLIDKGCRLLRTHISHINGKISEALRNDDVVKKFEIRSVKKVYGIAVDRKDVSRNDDYQI